MLAGWRTEARILFDVPPAAFVPAPKVTSSVVELIPRAEPEPCDAATLSALTQAAFGQRRKMLRQSLKSFAAARGLDLPALLAAAELEPTMRAEEVDVAGFVDAGAGGRPVAGLKHVTRNSFMRAKADRPDKRPNKSQAKRKLNASKRK